MRNTLLKELRQVSPKPDRYDLKLLSHQEVDGCRLTLMPAHPDDRYLLYVYGAGGTYAHYALDSHYTRVVLFMHEGDLCLIIAPGPDYRSCRLLCQKRHVIALDAFKLDKEYLSVLCANVTQG